MHRLCRGWQTWLGWTEESYRYRTCKGSCF